MNNVYKFSDELLSIYKFWKNFEKNFEKKNILNDSKFLSEIYIFSHSRVRKFRVIE